MLRNNREVECVPDTFAISPQGDLACSIINPVTGLDYIVILDGKTLAEKQRIEEKRIENTQLKKIAFLSENSLALAYVQHVYSHRWFRESSKNSKFIVNKLDLTTQVSESLLSLACKERDRWIVPQRIKQICVEHKLPLDFFANCFSTSYVKFFEETLPDETKKFYSIDKSGVLFERVKNTTSVDVIERCVAKDIATYDQDKLVVVGEMLEKNRDYKDDSIQIPRCVDDIKFFEKNAQKKYELTQIKYLMGKDIYGVQVIPATQDLVVTTQDSFEILFSDASCITIDFPRAFEAKLICTKDAICIASSAGIFKYSLRLEQEMLLALLVATSNDKGMSMLDVLGNIVLSYAKPDYTFQFPKLMSADALSVTQESAPKRCLGFL